MAITSLGTRTFNNVFEWISFDPIMLERDKVFALLIVINSGDPSLLYSSFNVRSINIFDTMDSATSNILSSFTYDTGVQFFPYQSWRGYDRLENTIFQVRREPFYAELSGISGATVELRIDPDFRLD